MVSPVARYVLVVDDNASNKALYERVISQIQSYVPKFFTSPAGALTWARRLRPGLVVVDYRMPEMDGVSFIRHFRTIPARANVPIIMLTSVKSPVLWQMALDAGATTYLTKPINTLQFLKTANKLLLQGELTTV
jgi:CheY-like chemotaxis protein